jgi:hypothetical protein
MHAADEANKDNAALLHLDLQEILEVTMMRPLSMRPLSIFGMTMRPLMMHEMMRPLMMHDIIRPLMMHEMMRPLAP